MLYFTQIIVLFPIICVIYYIYIVGSTSINTALVQLARYPIPHQVILSLLKEYKRPNDKINELVGEGVLTTVKKGLYIAGPALKAGTPEPYLLANYIYGPSYVSLESALSFHGMIPEKVYEVSSMTTKATRAFNSNAGMYTYTRLPLPFYAYGIEQIRFSDKQTALIATKEKALCDKIVTTSGILLRSSSQVLAYLLEDLRIDPSKLKELQTDIIHSWTKESPKKSSIEILIKALKKL